MLIKLRVFPATPCATCDLPAQRGTAGTRKDLQPTREVDLEMDVTAKKSLIWRLLCWIAWACVLMGALLLEVRSSTHTPDHSFLLGNWSGLHKGTSIVLIFNKDSTCELSVLDAESKERTVIRGSYSIDFTKDPLPLTITKVTGIDCNLHTIVEVGSADVIRIAAFSPTAKMRAVTFNDGFDLRRVPPEL